METTTLEIPIPGLPLDVKLVIQNVPTTLDLATLEAINTITQALTKGTNRFEKVASSLRHTTSGTTHRGNLGTIRGPYKKRGAKTHGNASRIQDHNEKLLDFFEKITAGDTWKQRLEKAKQVGLKAKNLESLRVSYPRWLTKYAKLTKTEAQK